MEKVRVWSNGELILFRKTRKKDYEELDTFMGRVI